MDQTRQEKNEANQASVAKKRKIMAISSVVVIVACGVYFAMQFKSTPPVEIPRGPGEQFLSSISAKLEEHSLKWQYLKFEPTADKTGVIFKGRVATAQDLELLKKILADGTPKVPQTFEVTAGR